MSSKITKNEVDNKCVEIVRRSFKQHLQYHVFATEYKALHSDMKSEIVSLYGSFVDCLSTICFDCLSSRDSKEYLFMLHQAIKDKVAIGLSAVLRIKIKDIEEQFMHFNGFVSTSVLEYIFKEFKGFEISSDGTVRLTSSYSESKASGYYNIDTFSEYNHNMRRDKEKQQEQLRYLYRCEPKIIKTLHADLTWKMVLDTYPFWVGFCRHSGVTLVEWLLNMAHVRDSTCHDDYSQKMKNIIGMEVMKCLSNRHILIKDIADLICESLPDVVTIEFLHEIIIGFSEWIVVSNKEGYSNCELFSVHALGPNSLSSMKDFMGKKIHNKKVDVNNFGFIPDNLLSSISSITTTKSSMFSIRPIFVKVMKNSSFLKEIIRKFGSFLQFLIAFAYNKKQDLNYKLHIQECVINLLRDFMSRKHKPNLTFNDAYEIVGPIQFMSENFLIKCLRNYPKQFEVHSKGFSFLGKLQIDAPCSTSKPTLLERKELNNMPEVSTYNEPSSLPKPNSASPSNFGFSEVDFLDKINKVLSMADKRLRDFLNIVNHVPTYLRKRILKQYNSLYDFVSFRLPLEKPIVDNLILTEVLEWLDSRTLTIERLKVEVLGDNFDFMSFQEIINFLQSYPKIFVVTRGSDIILARIRIDTNETTFYFNEFEKTTLNKIVQCYPQAISGINLRAFSKLIWNSNLIEAQRMFVFGTTGKHIVEERATYLLESYFKSYLCMYPFHFNLDDQVVYLINKNNVVLSSPEKSKKSVVIVISDTEDGEIVDRDDAERPKRRKRKRSRSRRNDSHKKKKSFSPKRDSQNKTSSPKKKKKKKSFSPEKKAHNEISSPRKDKNKKSVSPKKRDKSSKHKHDEKSQLSEGEEPLAKRKSEPVSSYLFSFPNHLTHDASVAKLLESSDNLMKINELCDYLIARVLNKEQQDLVKKNKDVRSEYQERIHAVLQQDDIFNLNYENGVPNSVKLIIKKQPSSASSTPIFQTLSMLTGVNNKELLTYVKEYCLVNNRPVAIPIIFTMTWKKFRYFKATEVSSDSMLQIQLIDCLKNDDSVFINVIDKTCCLNKFVLPTDIKKSYRSALKRIGKKKLIKNLGDVLKDQKSGLTIQGLCAKLSDDVVLYPKATMQLLVQGIVAERANENFYFLPSGHIARLQDEVAYSSPSDEETELVIEEVFVSPDSTEKPDIEGSETDIDGICNKYIEADVIRLESEPPRKRSADTTEPTPKPNDVGESQKLNEDSNRRISTDSRSSNNGCISSGIVSSSTVIASPKTPRRFSVTTPSENNKAAKTIPERPRVSNEQREEMLKVFLVEYLSSNSNSSKTEDAIKAAYRRYKHERFAISSLAFEAYFCDFVISSNGLFSFGSPYGGVGVTWLYYWPSDGRPNQGGQIPFIELLPEIPKICKEYLLKQPNCGENLKILSKFVSEKYSDKLFALHYSEVPRVCRTLILIGAIRTLKWFIFSKSQMYISVRQDVPNQPLNKDSQNDAPKNQKTSSDEQLADKHQPNKASTSGLQNPLNSQPSFFYQPQQNLRQDPRHHRHSDLPATQKQTSHPTRDTKHNTHSNKHTSAAAEAYNTSSTQLANSKQNVHLSNNEPRCSHSYGRDKIKNPKGDSDDRALFKNYKTAAKNKSDDVFTSAKKQPLDVCPKNKQPSEAAKERDENLTLKKKAKHSQMRTKALKLLSEIIHRNGPCTKLNLREYWSSEADKELCKILGSGVSFSISFRKYEKYFPTNSEGLVSVDETALNNFLQKIS